MTNQQSSLHVCSTVITDSGPPVMGGWLWRPSASVAALLCTGLVLPAALVTLTPEAPNFNVPSQEAEVIVHAAGIPEWEVKVPKGQVASFRFDPVRVLVDISTPEGNKGRITVRLPDGATAELGAASSARFDWFKDQTYYFSGAGKVSAKSPQGISSALSSYFLPLTGGLPEKDAGENRPKRRSPLVIVHLLSDAGKELHVRVDQEEVRIKYGEVRQIRHPNGSILELSRDEKMKRLRWQVIKGYFEFDIPETECWRAYTVTDQVGGLRHEAGQKGADVMNLSPESIVQPNQNIFADLHHNVTAAVHRRADFHYRQHEDCAHYDASAVGAPVDLSRPVQPGADQAGALAGGSAQMPGLPEPFLWSLRIPDGDAVLVGLNDARQMVDFKTGTGNESALQLRLADGGRAEIGAESKTRLDFLKDNTYYIAGSGSVNAYNADGQKFALGPLQPPVTGGPLLVTTDANGNTQLTRLSPITPVRVVGNLGDELVVQVGPLQVTVPADGSRTVTLPNGTELKLTQSADTRTLIWEADKGYFQFKVDGTGRWQADGLTGQSAAMQWGAPQLTGLPGQIDIQNLSSDSPLRVSLPSRTFAEVLPQSTLQYSQGDGPQFTASAVGGDVTIYNVRTGTETTLHPSDLAFRGGGLESGVGGVTWQPITVSGDEQTLIRVRGEGGNVALGDDVDQTLTAFNGKEFTVGSPVRGTLTLESTTGDHAVDFQALLGWTIYIPEGQNLTFEMDVRHGVVSATASGDNTAAIRITTSDGYSLVVPPDNTITFRLKPPPPPAGGLVRELVIIPPIFQPPVTVVR